MAKNLPANAGDTTDPGSIPGSGRSPGGRNGTLLEAGTPATNILAWETPRTEDSGRLQFMGSQRVEHK